MQGLRFTYSDESYRKHNRALVYDMAGGKTYRFVKNGDTWGFTDVGDTEFSWVNKKLAEYKATADEASVALSKLETRVGSDYITKVESQASIKLVQDSLTTQFVKTYATLDKLGNYSTTAEMYTTISESAEGIKRTVAASSSKWDCGSYDGVISYYEYGDPWENGYKAVDKFLNQYYLDVSNGCIYYCHYINGHDGEIDWKAVYNCKTTYTQLQTRAEQLESKFSWLVKSGDSESNMVLTDRLYELVTEHIDLTGLVTISSLKESGQTIINADNILTGTIKAVTIDSCNITGSAIAFRNDSGGWNSVINTDGMWVIGEGSADNPNFRVDNKGKLTARSGKIGNWDIGSGAIANNGTVLTADGQMVLSSDNNAIQLGSNVRMIPTALYVNQNGYSGSVPWWGVYKTAAQAVASDERIKQDIECISDEAYDRFFNSLQTYTYRFREGSGFKSDKTHIGFISQHIKKNLDEAGLSGLAVYDDDNPDLLGVDKQELIALCVWQIQKLKARVKELEINKEVQHE